jgi:hypothetical protein
VLLAALSLLAILFDWPLTALATAAVAAAIPIVIHLLNRNRYRVVTWAAMHFLLAAQRKHTRRMRLEQIILLALRTLIVLLLVSAMVSVLPWAERAWASIFTGTSLPATAGTQRTHKILVIDGSLSMGLKVEGETCFDRARKIAERILHDSPGGDGFSVLLMASPPRRIVPEPSDDARKVITEVQGLHLPHGNADLGATLQAVEDLLHRSPEKFQEREVYFITDLQRSTWTTRQAVDPMASLQKIQARASTILVDVGQDGANNLAVTNLSLGSALVTTGTVTPVTATIHNYGSDSVKQIRVALRVGKARQAAGDPEFDLRLTQHQFVDVAPAQSLPVTFAHKFTSPGEYAVQVSMESGDGLELDDTRSVVIAVKDTVPVMLVNGKPAVELYDRATEWLKDALNPYQPGTAPRQVAARPKVLKESDFADAGVGDLTAYDCVFLCDVARLGAAEVRRLETHLRRGGGVVFCVGPQVDLEAYNRVLYRNGEGILPGRLLGLQSAPPERFFSLFAEEDNYKQPPLEPFAADRDRLSLTGVRFRHYIRVEPPARNRARKIQSFLPSAAPSSDSPGQPADLPVGDPAVIAWPRHRGRVVLLTSTVNMDWTSWPISPSYPAFMQELLRFAVSGRLREQTAVVGDVLEEYLPLGSAGLDAVFHSPQGQTESTRTQDREDTALLRWSDTDVSGLYRATVAGLPRDFLFAVNVPTATDAQQACESDLTRATDGELHSTYPGWDFQRVSDPAAVVHSSAPAVLGDPELIGPGLGMTIARYLLLTLLVLALAEVALAWRFGHHSGSKVGFVQKPAAANRLVFGAVAGLAGMALLGLAAILGHAAWTGDFLSFMPDRFRRGVESGLGIPAPVSGEGSRWRLEYQPYLWDGNTDPWLASAIGLAAVVLVILIYRREGSSIGGSTRVILGGLRIGFILLALVMLLPQVRLLFERLSWPDIAILIDDSRSMSTLDHYHDPRVQEAADKLAALGPLPAVERLQLAQALLTRAKPDWLDALLTRHQVKIHVYHCSARAARIADVTDAGDSGQRQAAVAAIQGLRAEGESSQLGTALRQVLNDFRGSSLAAVIMLTDGVTTEGDDLVQAARHAARGGVPLFFVGVGDSHEVRDLKLHDLQVEDAVYVNDRIVFEVRLTGQGYTQLTVPVTLREKGNDKVLDTQTVKVDPEGKPVKVRLVHRPTTPGEKTYVLEVPEQPDEVHPADNNRIERSIFVREMKLIKVLYVEGSARYEYRFLKNFLERESSQDANNKTIDLKVVLLDADTEYAQEDKSALTGIPGKAELNQFDVIIFGDVDPGDKRIERHLTNVADFVREKGGGFLMIAGEFYSPHAFAGTPLQAILPIETVSRQPPQIERRRGYRPELTTAGRLHPIFRFSPDEADNLAAWNHLAEIYWWSEGYRIKPGAEVLAIHPQRKAEKRESQPDADDRHPLIVQQYVGAGRSMFFGIDETWRWRFREDELRFNQFWIQTVRYLARNRLGRISLYLDRQPPFRRGEPIKVTVRFPDEAPAPGPDTDVKVLVERRLALPDALPEIEGQSLTLAKVEGSRATYEAILPRTPEGDYQFLLAAPTVPGERPRAECRVLVPPGEMERLRMNQPDMERAAEETHGRFYTLATAEELLGELPPGSRVTLNATYPPPQRLLWNHWAIFLFALFLLSSEWFLRKRQHLV